MIKQKSQYIFQISIIQYIIERIYRVSTSPGDDNDIRTDECKQFIQRFN